MGAVDQLTLYDTAGRRKYLCAAELPRFLRAASRTDIETRALCLLLVFTGCRLSEALHVSPAQIDQETGRVVFRTLKRRRQNFRSVPVPSDLMDLLGQLAKKRAAGEPLWTWCRQTAWRRIKCVMDAAGIAGAHAMPKGLRHGFGVANAEENVPMATTQKWLGHAKLETTAIYQQAVGREEVAFAQRLWRTWQ
jgi:integrase